jgi:hypothetical protein
MGVRGETLAGPAHLVAEVVEVVFSEAALEEGTGVDAGRPVTLEEDLIASLAVGLSPEEVVEAHLHEGAAEAKVARWPPMPSERVLALVTMTAAFQRM